MKFSELSKKQKVGFLIIAFVAIIGVFILTIVQDLHSSKGDDSDTDAVARIDIPDAEVESVDTSKLAAYQNEDKRNKTGAEILWDNAEEVYVGDEVYDPAPLSSSSSSSSHASASASSSSSQKVDPVADILSDSDKKPSSGASSGGRTSSSSSSSSRAPKPGEPGYKEYRQQQFNEELERNRNEAMNAEAEQNAEAEAEADSGTSANEEPERMEAPSGNLRRSGSMSDMSSTNDGFTSFGDEGASESDSRPFECMFVREEKVRSGSRVSIRILEDLVVGGTLIPKNTHMQAICQINDRLELKITSIRIGSRIFSINYEAYDRDGYKGIYCPDLHKEERKQVTSSGLSIFNNLIGSRVGRAVSEAVQTGVSIAESRTGEIVVTVPMGYRFFLVESKAW